MGGRVMNAEIRPAPHEQIDNRRMAVVGGDVDGRLDSLGVGGVIDQCARVQQQLDDPNLAESRSNCHYGGVSSQTFDAASAVRQLRIASKRA